MSEHTARDLITRFLAAFNAAENEVMLDCLSEDVAHDINHGDRQIGKERLRWFLGLMRGHFHAELADIAVMTAPGGVRAAAEFTVHGIYLATLKGWPTARGQRFTLPAGLFIEVDDGLISRLTACIDLSAVREHAAKD